MSSVSTRGILLRALPAAVAIAVFGALYGAAARPLIGTEATLAIAAFVFSGALSFALVGLVAAGAGPAALLLTAVTLNLRHVVMGAVLRPMLGGSRVRRAVLAWFLLDETFGFAAATAADPAVAAEERLATTERTLAISGVVCYVAWVAGAVAGVLGAGVPGLAGFASAVFPVLFIGLAAIASRSLGTAARAAIAALITAAVVVWLPPLAAIAPVGAGLLVALPAGRRTGGTR